MGIETVVAIAGLAAAAASTGNEVYQSQRAEEKSDDAAAAQKKRINDLEAQQDATAAARTARLRQVAALAGKQGYGSTVATSPRGLSATQSAPTGPQPLTKLGA